VRDDELRREVGHCARRFGQTVLMEGRTCARCDSDRPRMKQSSESIDAARTHTESVGECRVSVFLGHEKVAALRPWHRRP